MRIRGLRPFLFSFAAAFAVMPAVGHAAAPAALRPLQGHIVEARATAASTLFLWDATPYVTDLVHERLVGDDGLHALEATAVMALSQRVRTSRSSSADLRVIYQKTGAVSPVYGIATFAGVEVVVTLHARKGDLLRNGAAWASALAQGTIPKGLAVVVSGKLPPPT
jgi:hypothetical protein